MPVYAISGCGAPNVELVLLMVFGIVKTVVFLIPDLWDTLQAARAEPPSEADENIIKIIEGDGRDERVYESDF